MDFVYELQPWAFGVHCACAALAAACFPVAVYYGALIKHRLMFMTVCARVCAAGSWEGRAQGPVGEGMPCPASYDDGLTRPVLHTPHSRRSASRSRTKTCSWRCQSDTPPEGRSSSGGS